MTDTSDWPENWRNLVAKLGEVGARAHLAERLRAAADQIDAGGLPGVYGCDVPEHGLLGDSFIATTGVILSHPWPG